MKLIHRLIVLGAVFLLVPPGVAPAQGGKGKNKADLVEASRNNPVIVKAFRDVVKKPSEYTVRVLADGIEVALGTVVGADGWILTKWSEVRDREKLTCKFKDGKVLEAKLVAFKDDDNAAYDLAMLKVDAKGLKTADWRPSSEATVGRWVASPGLSDDPVAIGVIGVGTRPLKGGDQFPNDNAGFLGVLLEETMGEGAQIKEVTKGSAAAKAKLRAKDVIFEIAGRQITDIKSLQDTILKFKAGQKVVLKIKRSEEELDVPVTLGRRTQGNPQDLLGSDLSNRRGGFPFILQHDTVLKPKDCGGPLVDLDGKTVGINIARAGRTETYAIPSEKVIALLDELKSGQQTGATILRVVGTLDAKDKLDKNRPNLKPNRVMKTHEIKLEAGTTYSIRLESTEFDPYLILEDDKGVKLAEDDDTGGFPNAMIVFTPKADGVYHIIATSFDANEKGSYTLTVRKQDAPKKEKD